MSVRLVSVNIERSKHLDLVIPFLQQQAPDVTCVQELCEPDITRLESELGMRCTFAPMGLHPNEASEAPPVLIGTGVFSSLPARSRKIFYYAGSEEAARSRAPQSILPNNPLTSCEVEKGQDLFRIATTHFTWSPQGMATDEQHQDMRSLLGFLASMGEFVLCGDFNAPRGGEIFGMLAQKYRDNIPQHYKTSIDANLHRNGKTRPQELADKMVDGLFSTPGYEVSDVKLVSGVSDHCAITAIIARKAGN